MSGAPTLAAELRNLRNRLNVLERRGVGSGSDGDPGLSAYEVAVANGFVGSESAWLASLVSTGGWVSDPQTWTRTGTHSFTVADPSRLVPGTKVSYNDAGVEFGVVASVSGTTVNLITNTSYSMAVGALTAGRYSYGNPPGFPASFVYAPTVTGYTTVPPVANANYSWSIDGQGWIVVDLRELVTGTKNATATSPTYSLPVAAKTITNGFWEGPAIIQNNTVQANAASLQIASAGTVLTVGSTYAAANAWTPSSPARVAHGAVRYPFF